MEGPKRIYLFPGIASGYESRTFPDEIEYTRADLVRELVEKGTDLVDVLDKLIHPAFVGYAKIEALRAALAALKAMEES